MNMTRPIKQRDPIDRCVVCDEPVSVWHLMDPLPSPSPEMLNLPPNAWIGLAADESGVGVVITCSQACTQRLLDSLPPGRALPLGRPS